MHEAGSFTFQYENLKFHEHIYFNKFIGPLKNSEVIYETSLAYPIEEDIEVPIHKKKMMMVTKDIKLGSLDKCLLFYPPLETQIVLYFSFWA